MLLMNFVEIQFRKPANRLKINTELTDAWLFSCSATSLASSISWNFSDEARIAFQTRLSADV